MSENSARAFVDPQVLTSVWATLRTAIRQRIQPEPFETWFQRADLTHVDDESVRIAVQNGFARDWLRNYYQGVLESAVAEVFGGARRIVIDVDPELTFDELEPRRPEAPGSHSPSDTPGNETSGNGHVPSANGSANSDRARSGHGSAQNGSLNIGPPHGLMSNSDVTLNAKYTFDNFVVGPCNRFAHAAAVGVGESPGNNYNPFFLHGSVGLGKTHLLQSMCYSFLERDPSTRILYLSCETFVNHFISALENGDLEQFRNKYRNVDVLVVDDIHILANKERTQEEFFHTFNTIYNAGKQIVMSSDSPPKDIPTLQERLVSRFKWGLVTEIEPPCYETRMAILKRKSRERGQEIPESVACLLAERIDSNIRELEGAVTKLLSFANLSNQPVTPELARTVLRDVFAVRRGHPSMEDIVRVVTDHFGVKVTDLQSRRRTNAVAYPRQVAMYLARKITRHSLEEIGGHFGGRDHSTVLHAVQKITGLTQKDPDCCSMLDELLSRLQNPAV